MANEGYLTVNLKANKSGANIAQNYSASFSMTGNEMMQGTQSIGTTAELVGFGNITGAPQMVSIRNLDATNYIELGGDSGLTVFKIKVPAGQIAVFTASSATLYAKANTSAVNILIQAVEI
jgi:hypothetical protein